MTGPSFRGSLTKTLVLQAGVYLLAIAVNTTIGRTLGKDGLGLYTLANNFLILSALVVGGGLQFANPYYLGQDPTRIRGVVVATWRWIATVAVISAGIVLTGIHAPLMDALLGVRSGRSWLIVLALPLFLAHQNAQAVFLGLRRFIAFNLIPLALTASTLLGVLAAVLLGQQGITGLLAAWLLAHAAVALVSTLFVIRAQTGSAGSPVYLRQVLSVGGRAVAANLLSMLVWRADVFLLHAISGRSAVGLYAAAVSVSEATLKIPLQTGTVLFSFVAGDSTSAAEFLAARTCRLTIAGVAGLCSLLVILGKPVLDILYGPTYLTGYSALLALLPGMIAWAGAVILSNYFAGRGYPAITYVAPVIALFADVALNLVLAPRLSVLGTALASSASYVIWLAILVYAFQRTGRVTVRSMLIVESRDWAVIRELVRKARHRLESSD